MKRLNKGLLVTSGICGGLGLALLICGMLLGGIRGGNDLGGCTFHQQRGFSGDER